MQKQSSVKLTQLELKVMDVLWRLGQATVREVKEGLHKSQSPAFTTVQTIIRRLEQKGAVRQVKKVGNAIVFAPAITQRAAHSRLVNELLAFFGGSARKVLAHLIEAGKLQMEDVREIQRMFDSENSDIEMRQRRKGS